MIISPLTFSKKIKLISKIKVSSIIQNYSRSLSIDVRKYFDGKSEIYYYECLDSGYRFYYPSDIYGDELFYGILEKFEWYYDPWKWEHEVASNLVSDKEKVLEVGCGKGSFVRWLEINKDCDCIGLELNGQNDLKPLILNENVQKHAIQNESKYDIVTYFQVLEHIYDVNSFIKSSLLCLKSGGKLIISVPNNAGFIGKDLENDVLNIPPHHMGHWDLNSLNYLSNLFPIKLSEFHYEPLRKQHVAWFANVFENRLFNNNSFLKILFRKLKIKILLKKILIRYPKLVKGHSILVVFIKN